MPQYIRTTQNVSVTEPDKHIVYVAPEPRPSAGFQPSICLSLTNKSLASKNFLNII